MPSGKFFAVLSPFLHATCTSHSNLHINYGYNMWRFKSVINFLVLFYSPVIFFKYWLTYLSQDFPSSRRYDRIFYSSGTTIRLRRSQLVLLLLKNRIFFLFIKIHEKKRFGFTSLRVRLSSNFAVQTTLQFNQRCAIKDNRNCQSHRAVPLL